LHILHHASAGDAFHDLAERYPQPMCHPEMWTRLLNDLWSWAPHSSKILWLHGPAGSGKSTVVQTFCQKLEDRAQLGGSFFF
ncbi:hypothetical protein K438DRAFT_1505217, partial [Mycena galopus ATCC 62051]